MEVDTLLKENADLKAQIAEFLLEKNAIVEENKIEQLELENQKLRLRIKMQENRLDISKNIRAQDFGEYLKNMNNEFTYFCYCGGKKLDEFRKGVKDSILEKMSVDKDGELIEKLFSTNQDFKLNQRFWEIKTAFLKKKIQEMKNTRQDTKSEEIQIENNEINKDLLRLVSFSTSNNNFLTANGDSKDESLDKDLLIDKLQEDLKNIIFISEQRKINRSILQSQFLKSDLFKKIVQMNRSHIEYINELEKKIQYYGKIIMEIEWKRKNELDELALREREGDIITILKTILNF